MVKLDPRVLTRQQQVLTLVKDLGMEGSPVEYTAYEDTEDTVSFDMRDSARNHLGTWRGTVSELSFLVGWYNRQKGG